MKTVSAPVTRRIRLSDIPATPWKNGGGVTREIATGAQPDGADGWGWRISVAEVAQDGPFSLFPDTDRVIAVIEGAGMDLLRPDGTALALEPFQPVRFAGEEPLDGRLRGGPVRDLNVMVRRGVFAAEMEIRRGRCSSSTEVRDGHVFLLCALTGPCRVTTAGGQNSGLAEGEILLCGGPERVDLEVAEGSRAGVIHILPR